MKTPEEFLREKYKLVDFANLSINAKPWIELMQEYANENYISKDKAMEIAAFSWSIGTCDEIDERKAKEMIKKEYGL